MHDIVALSRGTASSSKWILHKCIEAPLEPTFVRTRANSVFYQPLPIVRDKARGLFFFSSAT